MMFGGGMFFTWIILVVGAGFVIKYIIDRTQTTSVKQVDKSAVQILEERYARGEINRDQFESMKKDLVS